jgi:diguanylate cyclase (GGDEF)-like protein/PAS domain S-box-containing protein
VARLTSQFAVRLTLYYLVCAGLWIALSDRLLAVAVPDPELYFVLQTYKGWFFVAVTGGILYFVLRGALSSRIKMEHKLSEASEKLSALIEASPLAIITVDVAARVMSWNPAAEIMFGWKEHEVLGCPNPIVPEDKTLEFRKLHYQALAGKTLYGEEVTRQRKDGSTIDVSLSTSVIRNAKGDIRGVMAVLADITEQKLKEDQLKYLSLHDSLTGIYNRAYFEQEMQRLETSRHPCVGLIISDVDGLKLYNDSLGHDVGDTLLKAAADIIKNCFRESDMVARIGGDEFAVLLPDADKDALEQACRRIGEGIAKYNEENGKLYLSMSVGYSISEEQGKMTELFKQADNNMYKEKLRRNKSVRSATLQILMKALANRDFIADGHTDRMEDMVVGLAQEAGVSQEKLADLRLFARFHDIGKVGISEDVLLKTAPLTAGERSEIQRHSEIGHRVALSTPDLTHLADWILKHHEWWNGKGYPLGLREMEIPLECRMLAIADAYDALTSSRPYRDEKSPGDAYAELRAGAGEQFDPELVELFITMMASSEDQKIPAQL